LGRNAKFTKFVSHHKRDYLNSLRNNIMENFGGLIGFYG